MDLNVEELELLIHALAKHRPPGRAEETLRLVAKLGVEQHRQRVIAAALGPPTGARALVPIPGGKT